MAGYTDGSVDIDELIQDRTVNQPVRCVRGEMKTDIRTFCPGIHSP